MNSLAQFKRECVGLELTMVKHDWYPSGVLIGKPRKIVSANSVGCVFDGDSHLYWPKAKHVKVSGGLMLVDLNQDGKFTEIMSYTWETKCE